MEANTNNNLHTFQISTMWNTLDLDAILSEEERIPCVFQADGLGLGFLDPTSERNNLPKGARVELPLFMSKALSQRGMVEMELPKHYERRMRDNIAASALNINLKEFTPYYFEVGMQLSKELTDKDLQDTVRIAFCGDRYRSLMINSLSSSVDDAADMAKDLTARENDLYMAGVLTARELQEWRRQRAGHLKRSSLLGRRKRSTNENQQPSSSSSNSNNKAGGL